MSIFHRPEADELCDKISFLERENERLRQQAALVPDLAMLVRRLLRALPRKSTLDNSEGLQKLESQAKTFLKKHKLEGSPLR